MMGQAPASNADQQCHLRAVVHLAATLESLKSQANLLVESISTEEQGHFTPDQEYQVLSLLIVYWQSRNALLELVTSLRRDEELYGPEGERTFLIAFAAALILVDAARFLRETVEGRPIVKRKLNEPNIEFGIPAGVYDTVQKSLTSNRHAWHLYHAIEYYRRHEGSLLSRVEQESALQPLIDIIQRLKHRLDVSLTQFAGVQLRGRISQVTEGLRDKILGRAIYGLQKLGGLAVANRYVKQGHKPGLPTDIQEQFRQLLRPGDVIATRKEYALTNYFLPGYWPHVAVYLGNAEQTEHLGIARQPSFLQHQLPGPVDATEQSFVLESMKDGVLVRSLASPFASDSISILRPQMELPVIGQSLVRGLEHAGKSYDFSFDFSRSDQLVCTEVVYRSYDGMGQMKFSLVKRAGRMTLSGNDLVEMALNSQCLDVAAVYAPMFHPSLCTGQEATSLARRCLDGKSADR